MKIAFKDHLSLSKPNKLKLEIINEIIEGYVARDLRLTLRQLYYQLVTKNIIPNNDKEYNKIGDLLVKGRMCGIVDWASIVDRNRTPRLPYSFEDYNDAIDDAAKTYRIDRQLGQNNYIEMWVEKDALSEILYNKASKYHIRLMVNRGYTSCTAVYESFNRFRNAIKEGKEAHILYVGDHDPSGLDMIRDINDRLEEFGAGGVNVRQIALNQEQIKLYNPPPNPAKIKDPRASWYIKNFGDISWEVDALTPEVLYETIETNLRSLIDIKKYDAQVTLEKEEREKLAELPSLISDLREYRETLISDINAMEDEDLSQSDRDYRSILEARLESLEAIRGFSTL